MLMQIHLRRVFIATTVLVILLSIYAFFALAALSDFDVEVGVPAAVMGGTVERVQWDTDTKVTSVDIYISYDEGQSYTLLETSIPADAYFDWTVPNITHGVRLRVDARNGTTKIRGRGISDPVRITRDSSLAADSLLELEGLDPVALYYPNRFFIEGVLPDGIEIGDLLRSPEQPAVYFVGADGKRHPFQNETVYFSWFKDFDRVRTISADKLAQLSLGDSVRVRPGTHLIKTASVPKVYAVEPGGELIWIPTEEMAIKYFGTQWSKRVIDIPASLFTQYQEIETLCDSCNLHPLASLLTDGEDRYYMAEDGTIRPFEGGGFEANDFQERFLVEATITDLTRFSGVPIRAHEEVLVDYQDIGR